MLETQFADDPLDVTLDVDTLAPSSSVLLLGVKSISPLENHIGSSLANSKKSD